MKMMLLTFEQTEIRRAANLSELLLVEELFIEDLLVKMQRMGLIRLEQQIYKLTSKGKEQLNTGTLEEEMEEEVTMISYSPFHDACWPDTFESLPESKGEMPLFRYATDENLLDEVRLLTVLAERNDGVEEDGFQTKVAEVTRYDVEESEPVPFLEFQMYNKEQDIFYVRVWNTWLGRWDEKLEKYIEEKERLAWREKWLVEEEVTE